MPFVYLNKCFFFPYDLTGRIDTGNDLYIVHLESFIVPYIAGRICRDDGPGFLFLN